MAKHIIFLFCLIAHVTAARSYRILGIFPSADRNNHLTYKGLFRELANRNHNVTVISHFQQVDAPGNYHDISLSKSVKVLRTLSFETVIVNEVSRLPIETLVATKAGNDDCKTLLENSEVNEMIRARPRFDVIVVESYNSDCALALAANLSAPYIAFNPQPLHPWHFNRVGINFNAAHVPQSLLQYGRQPWFSERLKSFVLYYVTQWVYYIGSQVTDHVYLYKYLGNDLPTLESIASNASLVFVNTHQSVFGRVARADNVIDIGGIHIRPPKIIPTEIERFLTEAEHGVIYVNLGSTVKDTTLPRDKLNELLSAFGQLPLRVLWKWEGGIVENLPRNVMTMRWLPQYDILKHFNVKAFISHAGILSTIEALDAGIPVIAIPLFGDQYGNAAALVDAGVATIVPYENLSKNNLLDAIDDVLNKTVQERAKTVSRMWHDRPLSPLDTAIYWTEYVARYQGTPNLVSSSTTVPWYQQMQLDVLALVGVVLYILAIVIKKLICVCCCCSAQSDEQNVEKHERVVSKSLKFE